MTDRFLREYELTIGIGAQAVIIRPPFRIAFSADKSDDATLNKLTLKIYNLSEAKRVRLVRDEDGGDYFPLELKVGYQDNLETIFRGSINTAGSTREGAEFITAIECLDGGNDFLRAFVSAAVTTKAAVFDSILASMPNTARGKIGTATEIIRPKVLVGNSIAVTQEMLDPDQKWFIDDERLNILRPDEIVSSFASVISAETGLLNTPQADKTVLTLNTMMNPAVKVGGLFRLISVTAPHLNGIYKVSAITYSGDTDGNDWAQQVTGTIAQNYKVPQ
jgi:hypothetical protein